MNRYQLLTEAEIDAEKNQLLSQLSDEDLALIVGELDEAEGGRFAFDPLKKQTTAPRQSVQQQPKPAPKPQVQTRPQPKKVEPARKAEIKQTVDQLKSKEKAALVKAAKAELKKREITPKEVKPAQPGTLKKVVKNLALAAVAAGVIGGMFGSDDKQTSVGTNQQPTTVSQAIDQTDDVVSPFKYTDGATYYTKLVKSDPTDPAIKIYLGKRIGKSGTSYSMYAVDLSTGQGVNIKQGFQTDFDDLESAKAQFSKSIPLSDKYDLLPGSTQHKRYVLLKNKDYISKAGLK